VTEKWRKLTKKQIPNRNLRTNFFLFICPQRTESQTKTKEGTSFDLSVHPACR
jgi:hypothetical protein